jgi:hypothetical protein
MKPEYQGIDSLYKSKADNKDIRDLLEKLIPKASEQMKEFAKQFKGSNEQETCKKIFDYIKNNFVYIADGDEQIIKLPSALLRKKVGDCKSYSLFTASILQNLGIPYHLVYASYNDNPIPHHVYVQTDNGCIIDVVYGKFNQEKKAKYKYKKHMNVRYMAGLGDCGCDHTGIGKTKAGKFLQKVGTGVKKVASDVKGEIKKDLTKVEDKAKDVAGKLKQGGKTIGLAGGRAFFLLLVKNNFDGIASKIALGDTSNLLNSWYKLGGNRTNLAEAIKDGSQKREIKIGFLPRLKKILNIDGVGAFDNLSDTQKAAITGLCTVIGTAIGSAGGSVTIPGVGTIGGGALGTAIGGAGGIVVTALADGLVGALKRTPDDDSGITTPTTTPEGSEDTGNPDPTTIEKVKKFLPFALGIAVVGAGIYYATKKK